MKRLSFFFFFTNRRAYSFSHKPASTSGTSYPAPRIKMSFPHDIAAFYKSALKTGKSTCAHTPTLHHCIMHSNTHTHTRMHTQIQASPSPAFAQLKRHNGTPTVLYQTVTPAHLTNFPTGTHSGSLSELLSNCEENRKLVLRTNITRPHRCI